MQSDGIGLDSYLAIGKIVEQDIFALDIIAVHLNVLIGAIF